MLINEWNRKKLKIENLKKEYKENQIQLVAVMENQKDLEKNSNLIFDGK